MPLLSTLLAICQKFRELGFWKVMNCFALLADASFGASRTHLQQLLACLNFTLDSEDLFYWYKQKEWFLWTMSIAQAAENHGDEWGLTWYLWWGIRTSILTWTHSPNSLAAAEALSLKISSHGTSLKWSQRASQSAQAMRWNRSILLWIWWKVNGNWDKKMIKIPQWRESHCRTNTSNRRKKEIQNNRNVRITV